MGFTLCNTAPSPAARQVHKAQMLDPDVKGKHQREAWLEGPCPGTVDIQEKHRQTDSQANMPTVETSEGRVGDKIVTLLWMGSYSPIAHHIQLTRMLQNDLSFDRVLGWVPLPGDFQVCQERDFA